MPTLIFPLQKVRLKPPQTPTERTILLPKIPISIINKVNGQSFDTYALIDSGAWASLFPIDIARAIGIDPVENDLGEHFIGISN